LTVLTLVAAATAVRAAPVEFDGRFYEVVLSNGITWEQARDAANAKTLDGVQGHLATINSPEEDEFVFGLSLNAGGEVWIGGNQVACTPTPSPGCGWAWRNVSGQDVGEPISATNKTSPPFSITDPYTNWQPNEPNDHLGVDEVSLGIGLGGNRGWNDEGFLSNIRGYVVEYGDRLVSFPSANCKPGPCNLTGGNVRGSTISLPPSTIIPPDDVYTVRTWLVSDSASRCAATPTHTPQSLELDLLDAAGNPGEDGVPDVKIPPYLCTHPQNPQFLVIKTSSGVQIPSGVVAITNDTANLLNPSFSCQAPIANGNPLGQDIVVFQYDNKNDMLETNFTSLVDDEFDDSTVIESTNGCGTSRGSGGRGSFIFVGLSIQQGSAPTAQARLVDLLRHKLDLLDLAVDTAKSAGALKNGDWSKLKSEVKACRGDLTNGNFKEAYKHVQNFQKFLNAAVITPATGTGRNHDGELRMRIDNIGFTLKVKVMLQSP
jgi:hypothetical protein